MDNREIQIDMEVIARWESMGILEGLPIWEKEELAILYDNTVRLTLSKKSVDTIPQKIYDKFTDVNLPIVRRLYRRLGANFNLDNMLSKLIQQVNEKIDFLSGDTTPTSNPIVDFCIEFADSYSDELTEKNMLTDEEYSEQITNILDKVKDVLLNNKVVTNIDKNEDEWGIKTSGQKRGDSYTRFWNQKMGNDLLKFSLSEINKGS